MLRRDYWFSALVAMIFLQSFFANLAYGEERQPVAAKGQMADDLFGFAKLHEFHLRFSREEWEKMQKVRTQPLFPVPGKKTPEPASNDANVGGSFGFIFPFAKATLETNGASYPDVAVRYKGGGSYVTSGGRLQRNLKIELDRHLETQTFHGLKTITLNSEAADPSRFREILGYALYRAAGVPAPRTAFAEVTLTVPGKYEKEYVGLYTMVEHIDKTFLRYHLTHHKGLLMKPERPPDLPWHRPFSYRGENWSSYARYYGAKRDATPEEGRHLVRFLRLLHFADDAKFRDEIEQYLEVDEFLRFLAVTALIANLDSIFVTGHNCVLYLHPVTKKLSFMPWDLDLSFAGFGMFGTPEQLANLSITHPYPGENKLVERILSAPAWSRRYRTIVEELMATSFTKAKALEILKDVEEAAREPLARTKKAAANRKEHGAGLGMALANIFGPKQMSLPIFFEKRLESVSAQLAGTSKGFIPPGSGLGPPQKKDAPKTP